MVALAFLVVGGQVLALLAASATLVGWWRPVALALVLVSVHLGRTGPRVHRALRLWLYLRPSLTARCFKTP